MFAHSEARRRRSGSVNSLGEEGTMARSCAICYFRAGRLNFKADPAILPKVSHFRYFCKLNSDVECWPAASRR